MSHRHMDPGLVDMIQDLYKRVKTLERMETRRFTSLRIGHLIIEQTPAFPADPTALLITNLKTGVTNTVAV